MVCASSPLAAHELLKGQKPDSLSGVANLDLDAFLLRPKIQQAVHFSLDGYFNKKLTLKKVRTHILQQGKKKTKKQKNSSQWLRTWEGPVHFSSQSLRGSESRSSVLEPPGK